MYASLCSRHTQIIRRLIQNKHGPHQTRPSIEVNPHLRMDGAFVFNNLGEGLSPRGETRWSKLMRIQPGAPPHQHRKCARSGKIFMVYFWDWLTSRITCSCWRQLLFSFVLNARREIEASLQNAGLSSDLRSFKSLYKYYKYYFSVGNYVSSF